MGTSPWTVRRWDGRSRPEAHKVVVEFVKAILEHPDVFYDLERFLFVGKGDDAETSMFQVEGLEVDDDEQAENERRQSLASITSLGL